MWSSLNYGAELAELMKLEPASIHVVPNGVDAARFYKLETQTKALLEQTNVMDAAPILLLPVRVTPRKNIELALQTVKELQKQFPQVALVVTGPLGPHNGNNVHYFEQLKIPARGIGVGRIQFISSPNWLILFCQMRSLRIFTALQMPSSSPAVKRDLAFH
jgi:glycosyltransferase involved in cell wall biosynthesis